MPEQVGAEGWRGDRGERPHCASLQARPAADAQHAVHQGGSSARCEAFADEPDFCFILTCIGPNHMQLWYWSYATSYCTKASISGMIFSPVFPQACDIAAYVCCDWPSWPCLHEYNTHKQLTTSHLMKGMVRETYIHVVHLDTGLSLFWLLHVLMQPIVAGCAATDINC